MFFFFQQDINDNAPVFEKSIYRVNVSEDAEYGCKYRNCLVGCFHKLRGVVFVLVQ